MYAVTKKTALVVVSLLVILVLFATTCAKPVAPTPEQQEPEQQELARVEVKYNTTGWPEMTGFESWDLWPKNWIEEATHGRAEVVLFYKNALCSKKDMYRATQEGVNDFGRVLSRQEPGVFPLSEIIQLPGLFSNQAVSNVVLNELFRTYPCFEEQFSPKVKHISSQVHMRSDLHTKEPIRSLDELKGKVIACEVDAVAKMMQRLGAEATQMGHGDMYTACERGVVDGTVQAWGSFNAYRMYELMDYHTLISVCPGDSHFLFNRDTWNKFTPEEQERLEVLAPWFQYANTVSNNERSMEVHDTIEEMGGEFIELSAEDEIKLREAGKPMWDEWAEDMESRGYPGNDILRDAIKLIDALLYN